MIDTTDFKNKENELHFYLETLKFLDKIYIDPSNNYDKYIINKFSSKEYDLNDFIVILKSNAYMMIYNMIESTVRLAIYALYDEIKTSNVKYNEVTEPIRKLWRKSYFYNLDSGNAHVDKYKNAANKMIDFVLNSNSIVLSNNDLKLSGNADFENILAVMRNHDIDFDTNKVGTYSTELRAVKDKRNSLAHGDISFIQSARDTTVSDISSICTHVESFLDQMLHDVNENISKQKFKI